MNRLIAIFEKLLPERFWHKKPALNDEQFWTALAAPLNPQTQAVLHIAQDKFVSYALTAANLESKDDRRLLAFDQAMVLADFLTEVQRDLDAATAEVKRREAIRSEGPQPYGRSRGMGQ